MHACVSVPVDAQSQYLEFSTVILRDRVSRWAWSSSCQPDWLHPISFNYKSTLSPCVLLVWVGWVLAWLLFLTWVPSSQPNTGPWAHRAGTFLTETPPSLLLVFLSNELWLHWSTHPTITVSWLRGHHFSLDSEKVLMDLCLPSLTVRSRSGTRAQASSIYHIPTLLYMLKVKPKYVKCIGLD